MTTIDFVVQHQALIREVINGWAMVLCLTLTIMVGVFMWDSIVDWYAKPNTVRRAGRSWHEVPGIQTACAMWWIFLAESYRTGSVWLLYNIGKGQKDVGVFFSGPYWFGYGAYWSSYGYLFAGIVLNLGLLRAIYIFTPPEWKNRVWVYAAIGAAIFCASPIILGTLIGIYINGL